MQNEGCLGRVSVHAAGSCVQFSAQKQISNKRQWCSWVAGSQRHDHAFTDSLYFNVTVLVTIHKLSQVLITDQLFFPGGTEFLCSGDSGTNRRLFKGKLCPSSSKVGWGPVFGAHWAQIRKHCCLEHWN